MPYVLIGSVFAILELWRLISPRAGTFSLPQPVRILMPVVLAIGVVRRPRAEWPATLGLAIVLALALNRDWTGESLLSHAVILVGCAFVIWSGAKNDGTSPKALHRLAIVLVLTVLTFLAFFVMPLLV